MILMIKGYSNEIRINEMRIRREPSVYFSGVPTVSVKSLFLFENNTPCIMTSTFRQCNGIF